MRAFSFVIALWSWGFLCSAQDVTANRHAMEQTYSQSPSTIKSALKYLPGGISGTLPVLDGFVVSGERKLEDYERARYECQVRITPVAAGRARVRVSARITAWYRGKDAPGYQTLESNGRIESDVLERLQEKLQAAPREAVNSGDRNSGTGRTVAGDGPGAAAAAKPDPSLDVSADISAPVPQLPKRSALSPSTPGSPSSGNAALEQEAKSLEEILRNQSHPTNLIAVKGDQTPVSESPSAGAKVLFLASAEDEFEILDVNPEWVHVRISGLSRGWLRRSGVEMIDNSIVPSGAAPLAPTQASVPNSAAKSSPLFSISADEEGAFPGDWLPLKGKRVKIISVQQALASGRITSPQDKMRFAESVFRQEQLDSPSQGLVLIFDAEDGGMIAATTSVLEKWKKGTISEEVFWRQCFLDPPELLGDGVSN